MNITLTLDDFSVLNNRLDLLWRLREHFHDFKVSLFMIPDDIKHKTGNRDEALVRIKECLGWIEVIPHGLKHNGTECRNWDYNKMKYEVAPKIQEIFDRDGLPFQRGFKAPHWTWNHDVVHALNDLGWFGAVSPKRTDQPVPKRSYIHDYSIHENFPLDRDLKLQGHINGTSPDDLELCFDNLLKLSQNTIWHFVSEHIK